MKFNHAAMNLNCPCCAGKLLQHIDRHGLYWYCLDCRQAMPSVLLTQQRSQP